MKIIPFSLLCLLCTSCNIVRPPTTQPVSVLAADLESTTNNLDQRLLESAPNMAVADLAIRDTKAPSARANGSGSPLTLKTQNITISIPARPYIPAQPGPDPLEVVEHIGELITIAKMQHENSEFRKALKTEANKLKAGESADFQTVTRGDMLGGGDFVGLVKASDQHLTPPELTVHKKFTIYGKLPPLASTPLELRQLEQLKANYEAIKAQAKKDADAAAERIAQAKLKADAAAKAKADAEAAANAAARAKEEAQAAAVAAEKAKATAAEAAAAAERQRIAKAKQEADARRAEQAAQRDGQRVQNNIRGEIERFKREGGNYRAPTGGGGR